MADFLEGLKKRFGRKKAKGPEPDVAKATLERLTDLRARVATDRKGDTPQEFFRVVKEFFQKSLKIKYQFTYEELIVEIARHKLDDELKKILIDFAELLTKMEFSERRFDRKYLLQQMDHFETLVIKTSEDLAMQAKKGRFIAPKQKPAKQTKPELEPEAEPETNTEASSKTSPDLHPKTQPVPAPAEIKPSPTLSPAKKPSSNQSIKPAKPGLAAEPRPSIFGSIAEALTKKPEAAKPAKVAKSQATAASAVLAVSPKSAKPFAPIKHSEFKKIAPAKEQLSAVKAKPIVLPKPLFSKQATNPSPVPAIPTAAAKAALDDKVSQIYDLFNTGYEHINKKKPVDAREALIKIRKLNDKLDKDAKLQFKAEIAHLEEEITYLQSSQKEQAKKALAKQKSEQAVGTSQKSKQPKLTEPAAARPKPFSFFSRLIPKPADQNQAEAVEPIEIVEMSADVPEEIPDIHKHPLLKKKIAKAKAKLDKEAIAKGAPAVEPALLSETPSATSSDKLVKKPGQNLQPQELLQQPSQQQASPDVAEKKKGIFAGLFKKQEKPAEDGGLAAKLDTSIEEAPIIPVVAAEPKPKSKSKSESRSEKLRQQQKPAAADPAAQDFSLPLPDTSHDIPTSANISLGKSLPAEPLSAIPSFEMAGKAGAEEAHELPRLSGYDSSEEEQRRISALVEQMYQEIKAKNKHGDEQIWGEYSPFDRFINRPFFKRKPKPQQQSNPLSETIAQSPIGPKESETLLPSMPLTQLESETGRASLAQSKPSSDREGLQKISALVSQMHVALSAKDLSGASLCWARIISIRQYLSPAMQRKLGGYTAEIEQELESLKTSQSDVIVSPPFPSGAEPVLDTNPVPPTLDHNQMIAEIFRSTPGFAPEPNQPIPVSSGRRPVSPAKRQLPKPAPFVAVSAAAPKQQPQDRVDELTSMIDTVKELIRSERIEEATEAYKKAVSLRRKLVASEDVKNKLNYDLMGINVELRMAQIK